MTDRKDFLQGQAARLEAARRAELERRLYLIAKFVPHQWLSLGYTGLGTLLNEQPKIIVTAKQ